MILAKGGRVAIGPLLVAAALQGCTAAASPGNSVSALAGAPSLCHAWTYVVSPAFSAGQFGGVSGISSNDVWGAGYLLGGLNPLIEHWDGTAWTQTPQPQSDGLLLAAAAITTDDAWVAGSIEGQRTLIEHWDGTAWTVIPSPSPGNPSNGIDAMTAISSTDIWAAGFHSAANGSIQPLYLHWNGSVWRAVKEAPGTPVNGGEIYGIAAVSSSDVWAVGYQGARQFGTFDPLTEQWDGHSWHVVPAAAMPKQGTNEFAAVYASSPDDVWAVGRPPRTASCSTGTARVGRSRRSWRTVHSSESTVPLRTTSGLLAP